MQKNVAQIRVHQRRPINNCKMRACFRPWLVFILVNVIAFAQKLLKFQKSLHVSSSQYLKSFHDTRCTTPKRVTSFRSPSPRHCARQHSSFRRNVAAVASRWQHCIQFDRPKIITSYLPLQRRTCYR